MDAPTWNGIVSALPGAHVLQSWEWGEFKSQFGWTPLHQVWHDKQGRPQAAALVLQRTLALGGFAAKLRVLYVPRGPVMDWNDKRLRERVLTDLQALARRRGAIFIKIDPEVVLGTGVPGSETAVESDLGLDVQADLHARRWRYSSDQIQFRNTVWLDLTPPEDVWLARMKQKTRYNLRLAQKKGVTVRDGGEDDLGLLYRLYAETALRDGFTIRSEAYYRALWGQFLQKNMARALIAEVEGQPVGAVLLFLFAGRAWYLFGMSREEHREKMPSYLLQWEAMRAARAAGCSRYDLWGAPEVFNEEDSLWGVYRFKEGLGGQVVRTLGAWDYTPSPFLYRLYTNTLPRILDWMRRRGKQQTRQSISV